MISHSSAIDDGFKAYIDYLALKRHFETDGYDYQKYRGKVKASIDSFRTRPDAFFFQKLTRQEDFHEKLLANIVVNPKVWIRDIVDEQGEEVYLAWKKRIESLTYTFQQDLNKLNDDYKSNYVVNSGQHPKLMSLFLQKQISLETFTILFHISKVSSYWEKEIVDKFIARDIMRLIKKYYPFLQIDEKKFSQIVKNKFF
jgi:hypothetical protein